MSKSPAIKNAHLLMNISLGFII